MNKKNGKIVIKAIIAGFMLIGLIGWLLPLLGSPFQPQTELPNTEPKGILLDSNGNIYCGSEFYGRIQKYYPDGRFSRGFNVQGGTDRGTDFGFYINEYDHLCVIVSGLSKDNENSVHLLKVYDQDGNVIKTERSLSNDRNYAHQMKASTTDSNGNLYIIKGILFPRVVKKSQKGDRTIIITTPLWLWFFQAPFPAFAFFFISMFILLFLSDKAAMFEAFAGFFAEKQNLQKFIKIALIVILIIIILIFLTPIALNTYPATVIFGFLSFAIATALIGVASLIYILRWTLYCQKNHPELSAKKPLSMRERLEYGKFVREKTADDIYLCKLKLRMNKFIKVIFFLWFTIFVIISIIIINIGPILT